MSMAISFKQPETGGVKTVQKYFVSLPIEQAHQDHPVGQAPSFCQRIHLLILNKVSDQN